ncbi:hypothetical protein SAMN05421505_1182 [Sinosporangium album]|uniref:Magnesium transporter NIPA n=1 Tax=Sinosporangium album TaxID=504805 RepID=A0A1G8DCE5_9ACTN|nr:DMT family transporter [Sinosporangium album]SDH55283.1 hypothetical protein SAMN05421505_1182 [Sinosporangium album]
MTDLTWLVVLSVLSATGYAGGAVAQEHYAGAGRGARGWIVPLLFSGAGAGLHVAALPFGPIGLVQALGTLTLVFALPIAAVRGRGRITRAAWGQAWLTVIGLTGLLVLSTGGTTALSDSSALWLAAGVIAVVATLVLTARHATAPISRGLLLAAAAGSAFGVASILTKDFMADAAERAFEGMWLLAGGVIVGLSALGQVLGQLSYRGTGLAAPLAMISVINPVIAGAIGLTLLGDGIRFGAAGAVLTIAAALITAGGVIGLASQSRAADATPAAEPATCNH